MIKVYQIIPVPAPRQVGRDAYNPSPPVIRYRAYRDELRLRRVQVPTPFYHGIFVMPMPPSWASSKRTASHGQPHTQKPDRDNLEKALLDSCFEDDAHVWNGQTTKLWGRHGMLIISERAIPIVLPFDLVPYYQALRSVHPFTFPRETPKVDEPI